MPEANLAALLGAMDPVLHEGVHVFAVVLPGKKEPVDIDAFAMLRETEGTTYITTEAEARRAGLKILFRAAWITLNVNSDLAAVGFTAAFSGALGAAGISCNVVAAAHHDHVFVPVERAEAALRILESLRARPA